jgi:hypothetical protein
MSTNRLKVLLVSLFAVFAVSAVASASASAACPDSPTEGDVALCKGGLEQEGNYPFESEKTAATASKLEVAGAGPIIKATVAKNTGQFEQDPGPPIESNLHISDLSVVFAGAKVTNTVNSETKCKVNSPGNADGYITVTGGKTGDPSKDDLLDGVFTGASTEAITIEPSEETEAKKIFVVIEIGNKNGTCPFATGKFNVTGKQKGKLVGAQCPGTDAVTHKIEFLPTESELKFGTSVATFELTEDVKLVGGEAFSLCPS